MKAVILVGVFLLSSVVEFEASVLTKNKCPPSALIHPCTCVNNILTCRRISDLTVLGKVIKNSAGYKYDEVKMLYAVLQYIPKDLFNQTEVKRLTIQDSKLVALFNDLPSPHVSLEAIHINNSRILRGYWKLLSPFTNLQFLKIHNSNNLKSLDSSFAVSLPKSINTIIINRTDIQKITTGAFARLANLKKLTISNALLSDVNRKAFPTPFKVKDIDFSNNKFTSIPKDLFSKMPELRVVNLKQNNISAIPEAEFNDKHTRVVLLVNGNPLKCDCNLVWTAKNATSFIDGTCAKPENLKGQRIADLWTGDFMC